MCHRVIGEQRLPGAGVHIIPALIADYGCWFSPEGLLCTHRKASQQVSILTFADHYSMCYPKGNHRCITWGHFSSSEEARVVVYFLNLSTYVCNSQEVLKHFQCGRFSTVNSIRWVKQSVFLLGRLRGGGELRKGTQNWQELAQINCGNGLAMLRNKGRS